MENMIKYHISKTMMDTQFGVWGVCVCVWGSERERESGVLRGKESVEAGGIV